MVCGDTGGASSSKTFDKVETVLLDLDDEEKATKFEKKTVLSKCHAGSLGLVQSRRWKLLPETPQIVMTEAKYVIAIREALGKALPSMIFLDKLSPSMVKSLQAVKTRLMCRNEAEEGAEVLELWAVRGSADQPEVGIVHPATPITLSLPTEIRITLKLTEEHATSQEAYQNFGSKDQLARYLGPALEKVDDHTPKRIH